MLTNHFWLGFGLGLGLVLGSLLVVRLVQLAKSKSRGLLKS